MLKVMVLLNLLMQMKSLSVMTRTEEEKFVSFDDDIRSYNLTEIQENQPEYLYQPETCCKKGEKVVKGQILTEGYATKGGELALG